MANTKSAIKRIRRISRQTAVNKSRKSRFKNVIKKMNILLDSKKHGDKLMKNNILFAPDYVINAGGLINVASEIDGYDEHKVKSKTEQIYDTLLNIYDIADSKDISTSEAASKLAKKIIKTKCDKECSEI